MKNIIITILAIAMTMPAFAVGPAPEALKDGVITVTLKDGKVYTFSSNEYAVVKRGTEASVSPPLVKVDNGPVYIQRQSIQKEANKNMISIGAVRSQSGLDYAHNATTHVITTKYEIGASLMYQRNVYQDLFLGGRIDTNSGAELNLGIGF